MDKQDWLDDELEQHNNDLERGEITVAEYNKRCREAQQDYREQAESSAREAYEDEMDRW